MANFVCPFGQECATSLSNPNYGHTNFDNLLYSFVSVFQVVTLEGWTDIMLLLRKAYSEWVILFFVTLVCIGAFFIINITLAVVKSAFTIVMGNYR